MKRHALSRTAYAALGDATVRNIAGVYDVADLGDPAAVSVMCTRTAWCELQARAARTVGVRHTASARHIKMEQMFGKQP